MQSHDEGLGTVMNELDVHNAEAITMRLRQQSEGNRLRVTAHDHQEMVEEGVSLDNVINALRRAVLVENYPDHKRGACCLVCGQDESGRDLHIVCTTSLDIAIIITVYEPQPPKWVTPFKRSRTQ